MLGTAVLISYCETLTIPSDLQLLDLVRKAYNYLQGRQTESQANWLKDTKQEQPGAKTLDTCLYNLLCVALRCTRLNSRTVLSPLTATPRAAHYEDIDSWKQGQAPGQGLVLVPAASLLLGAVWKGQAPQQQGWEKAEHPSNDTRLLPVFTHEERTHLMYMDRTHSVPRTYFKV